MPLRRPVRPVVVPLIFVFAVAGTGLLTAAAQAPPPNRLSAISLVPPDLRPNFPEQFGLGASAQTQAESQTKQPPYQKSSPGHIFWVVPAFKVYDLKDIKPLTPREKFYEWARGAYDPLGLATGATEAALEHSSSDGFCGYGEGWGGYGECYGSALLDANISSFFGDYLLPTLMHQDPRYFPLQEGPFGRRVFYAVSRVFVTRTDSGRTTIDSSALTGTVIGATMSNLYYPRQDRGLGLTVSRIGWDLAGTVIFNMAAEFWPNIKHKIDRTF